VLLALLGSAIWIAVSAWQAAGDVAIPVQGYIAMALGIVFSVLVGCGLMALVFYSNRKGYDEPPQRETKDDTRSLPLCWSLSVRDCTRKVTSRALGFMIAIRLVSRFRRSCAFAARLVRTPEPKGH